MAETDTPIPPASEAGATKSFWEHLQDLRTALVRSAIAIGVALVLCLMCAKELMYVLEFPLQRMNMFDPPIATVTFILGTDAKGPKFGPYEVTPDQFPGLPPGDPKHPPHAVYHAAITPVQTPNGLVPTVTLTLDQALTGEESTKPRLNNFSPNEGFFLAFHVSLYAALVLSSPFWVYFMGGFIMPAFHMNERRVVLGWIGWSIFLFLLGVLSTYFVLLPVALRASLVYSDWLGFDWSLWRATDYINFSCIFIFGMGLGFQFPLVVLFLVKIGVVNHKQLAHYRRHVIVVSFILGALLTTPEVITQVAMAIPLCLLYEICIWIAWYWERKKRLAES